MTFPNRLGGERHTATLSPESMDLEERAFDELDRCHATGYTTDGIMSNDRFGHSRTHLLSNQSLRMPKITWCNSLGSVVVRSTRAAK